MQHIVISCLTMHNMMVDKRLEHGDEFSGDHFDNNYDYETDEDGKVLDEAAEFVCMIKWKCLTHNTLTQQHNFFKTAVISQHTHWW